MEARDSPNRHKLTRQSLHHIICVHVEESFAPCSPLPGLVMEDRAGVSDCSDRSHFFHIAAFDRFEVQLN